MWLFCRCETFALETTIQLLFDRDTSRQLISLWNQLLWRNKSPVIDFHSSDNSYEPFSDLIYFEDLVTCEEGSRSRFKHSHRSFNIRHFQTRRYETKVFIELLSPSTSERQFLFSWPHIRNSYMLFQTAEQMKTVSSLYFTSFSLLICLPVSHPRSAFCFLLSLCLWTSVFSCSTADYLYQGISIIAVFFFLPAWWGMHLSLRQTEKWWHRPEQLG